MISRDRIQFLTTTGNFVAFFYVTGHAIFAHALFLVGVKSGRPVSAQVRKYCRISGARDHL